VVVWFVYYLCLLWYFADLVPVEPDLLVVAVLGLIVTAVESLLGLAVLVEMIAVGIVRFGLALQAMLFVLIG
jgi:hypothetical protein